MTPPKTSMICDMLLFGLENTTILVSRIPQVRRLALIESIHYNLLHNMSENIDKEVLEIVLYNVQTSPYLSNTDFYDAVAESMQLVPSSYIDNETAIVIEQMIRDENWDELISSTSNFSSHHTLDTVESKNSKIIDQRLKGFREMVLSVISTSKVLAKMKRRRRKRLKKRIRHAKTVEGILEIANIFLDTSNIFKEETDRKKIKDLIAVGRFDLLLLPDCFNCDDEERLQQQDCYGSIANNCDEEEEDYCVICFEDMDHSAITTTLECNHRFCTSCIQTWMMNHVTCPTCRGTISGTRLRRNRRRERRLNPDHNNLPLVIGLIFFIMLAILALRWLAIFAMANPEKSLLYVILSVVVSSQFRHATNSDMNAILAAFIAFFILPVVLVFAFLVSMVILVAYIFNSLVWIQIMISMSSQHDRR